jgi:hypothetical protein
LRTTIAQGAVRTMRFPVFFLRFLSRRKASTEVSGRLFPTRRKSGSHQLP